MAIAYVDKGGIANGTTSVSPTYPVAVTDTNLLILVVSGKYPTNYPTTPTGFTPIGVGISTLAEAPGVDAGDTWVAAYFKIADGTEDGATEAVTVTSANSSEANFFQYSKAAGKTLDIAYATGGSAADGTAVSVTFGSNPGITSGDFCQTFFTGNTDAGAASALSLTATDATIAGPTQNESTGTTQGDDIRMYGFYAACTAGTATAAPLWTNTCGVATTVSGILVRLREIDPNAVGTAAGTSTAAAAGISTSTAVGSAAGSATAAAVGDFTATASGYNPGSALVAAHSLRAAQFRRSFYAQFLQR